MGFVLAFPISAVVSTVRVTVASSIAYLVSHLTDVMLFDRLRNARYAHARTAPERFKVYV